jgi:hypothetical protein
MLGWRHVLLVTLFIDTPWATAHGSQWTFIATAEGEERKILPFLRPSKEIDDRPATSQSTNLQRAG